MSINGVKLNLPTTHGIVEAFAKATDSLKVGDPIKLVVSRNDKEMTLDGKMVERSTKRNLIESVASPTTDQLALRKLWLARKR